MLNLNIPINRSCNKVAYLLYYLFIILLYLNVVIISNCWM